MLRTYSTSYDGGLRTTLFAHCLEPGWRERRILCAANEFADRLSNASAIRMEALVRALRDEVSSGVEVTDDKIMIPALALARESLKRSVKMTAYDVQILAGIAMCRGAICEMKTGEGKTLASVFPMVVHALTGKGVHVATVNAYLTDRDFELIGPALRLLGLSAGISRVGGSRAEKREAYGCDVTFATGYELGFDYLRDQISLMSREPERLGAGLRRDLFQSGAERPFDECQRGHALAIIDEADSVLIDEAITPLVLSSGGSETAADDGIYHAARWVAA
jgi:preprotein translocase subunit SecA